MKFDEFLRLIGNGQKNLNQRSGETDEEFRARKSKATSIAIKNIGNSISSAVDKWGSSWLNLEKARFMSEINITRANYTKQTDIIKTQLGNLNVQISKTLSSGLGILTKTANEAAYDSGRAVQEIAKSNLKARLDIINIGKKAELEIAQAKLDKFKAEKEFENQIINTLGSTAQSIGSALGSVGTVIGAALKIAASVKTYGNKKDIMKSEIAIEQIKLENEMYQKSFDIVTEQVGLMEGYVEPFRQFVQSIDTFAGKFDTATHVFAATIGYNGAKGREFADYYRKAAISVAETFGASAEEIQKLQEVYMSASSRAVNLSINDMLGTMSVSRLFGMSPTESAQLFGGMNVFNTSISDGSDMMNHMYKTITKMGLSTSKFGKDLVQNLKLAEKYNFKGGLENMMKMTKWAQQTRFNLNSATSFADKLVNGSLSEVLESSAKLQVLGGAAAVYSDPLGMMYDAGADVGDMAKRMAAMFSDITGTFNKETGETEFDWYENRMIGARAQALGMDAGEARNIIRQNQKQGVINRELSGLGLSEDDMLALGNKATYNRREKRWEVTDIHGKTHDIKEYGNGSNLNINDLLPENNDEAMLEIAKKSLGVEEEMKAQQAVIMTTLSDKQFGDYAKNIRDRMAEQERIYLQNNDNVNTMAGVIRNFDTKSLKTMGDNLKTLVTTGRGALDEYFEFALNESGINTGTLSDILNTIKLINGGTLTEVISQNILREMGKKNKEDFKNNGHIMYNNLNKRKQKSDKFLKFGSENMSFDNSREFFKNNYGFDIHSQGWWDMNDYYVDKNGNIYEFTVDNETAQGIQRLKENKYIKKFNGEYFKSEQLKEGTNLDFLKSNNLQRIGDGTIDKNGVAQNFVAQNGKTTHIDSNDYVFAATNNGPFALMLQQLIPGLQALLSGNGSSSNDVNINVNGRLDLSQSGSTVNVVDIIKNNPSKLTEFVAMLERTAQINVNGKATNNSYV